MKRIAIIGAGMSGLVLAHALAKQAEVVVFEKARGCGGRMSTRYADSFCFDHGAQYFTARDADFQQFIATEVTDGVVAEWKGPVIDLTIDRQETLSPFNEPWWVATPNMNSLCKALIRDFTVRTQVEVAPLTAKHTDGWHLEDLQGTALGVFDWVMSCAPLMQTVKLFDAHLAQNEPLRAGSMQGCYALMLGFEQPWDRPWIAARVANNPIQWIGINSSKPERDSKHTCMVVHSESVWAETHIDEPLDAIKHALMTEFAQLTGIDPTHADYVALHRWRYAVVHPIKNSGNYMDATLKLAASGDWCEASRIEAVWLHARKLASMIAGAMD